LLYHAPKKSAGTWQWICSDGGIEKTLVEPDEKVSLVSYGSIELQYRRHQSKTVEGLKIYRSPGGHVKN